METNSRPNKYSMPIVTSIGICNKSEKIADKMVAIEELDAIQEKKYQHIPEPPEHRVDKSKLLKSV